MSILRRWWWSEKWWALRYWIQRATRGYDERDLFNLGDLAASRMAKLLRRFIAGGIQSVPCVPGNEEDEIPMRALEPSEWEAILVEMAEGYEAAEHLGGCCECKEFNLLLRAKTPEQFDEWRRAAEAHDAKYRAKWERGLDLSKKWLLAVWN